jgi:DNA polymerase III epsilon subunit family exonuclease
MLDGVKPHRVIISLRDKKDNIFIDFINLMIDTKGMKFISFDLETTGVKPKTHAITEVAFLKFDSGRLVDKFVSLVNPGQPIPSKITSLTGISDLMVKDQPSFLSLAPKISKFIGNDLLVAYNAPFDKRFLNVALYEANIHSHFNPLLCSMALTVKGQKLSYWPKLMEALSMWKIAVSGNEFHRAEFDAYHNGLMVSQIMELVDPQLINHLISELKIPNEKYQPKLYAEYLVRKGLAK